MTQCRVETHHRKKFEVFFFPTQKCLWHLNRRGLMWRLRNKNQGAPENLEKIPKTKKTCFFIVFNVSKLLKKYFPVLQKSI